MVSREEEERLNSLREDYNIKSKIKQREEKIKLKEEKKRRKTKKFSDVKEAMRRGEEDADWNSKKSSGLQTKAYIRGNLKRYVEKLPEHNAYIGAPAWDVHYSFPHFMKDIGGTWPSSPGNKRIILNKLLERFEQVPIKKIEEYMSYLQSAVNLIKDKCSDEKMQQIYLSRLYNLAKEKGVKKKSIEEIFAVKENPYLPDDPNIFFPNKYSAFAYHTRDKFRSTLGKNIVKYKGNMRGISDNNASFKNKLGYAKEISEFKRNLKPVYKQLFNALQKDYSPQNEQLYKEFVEEHPSKGLTNLEKAVFSSAITASFLGSLIFLSSNMTGNTILNSSFKLSNMLGAGLFIIAVVGAFLYIRKTNKTPKKVVKKTTKKAVKNKAKKKKSKK